MWEYRTRVFLCWATVDAESATSRLRDGSSGRSSASGWLSLEAVELAVGLEKETLAALAELYVELPVAALAAFVERIADAASRPSPPICADPLPSSAALRATGEAHVSGRDFPARAHEGNRMRRATKIRSTRVTSRVGREWEKDLGDLRHENPGPPGVGGNAPEAEAASMAGVSWRLRNSRSENRLTMRNAATRAPKTCPESPKRALAGDDPSPRRAPVRGGISPTAVLPLLLRRHRRTRRELR